MSNTLRAILLHSVIFKSLFHKWISYLAPRLLAFRVLVTCIFLIMVSGKFTHVSLLCFSRKVFCGREFFDSYSLYAKFVNLCWHCYGKIWALNIFMYHSFFATSIGFLGALFFKNLIEINKPLEKNYNLRFLSLY